MTRLRDAVRRAREDGVTAFDAPEAVPAAPWDFSDVLDPLVAPASAARHPVPDLPVMDAEPEAIAPHVPQPRRRGVRLAIAAVVLLGAAASVVAIGLMPRRPMRLAGIVSANEVVVSSPLGGRLARLMVDEGASVQAGALVGVMDQRELIAERDHERALLDQLSARLRQTQDVVSLTTQKSTGQVAQAEAELRAARSDRDEAQADLAQKVKDAARGRALSKDGIIPQQQTDQLETAVRTAEARVQSLDNRVRAAQAQADLAQASAREVVVAGSDVAQTRAQMQQAEAAIAEAEARLKDTEIRAPLSGIIALRVVRQGEVVRVGDPIVTIVDPDDMWVRAEVDETKAPAIAVGQTVAVDLPSGERVNGRVSLVEAEAEFATQRDVSRTTRDVRTFAVRVSLPNPERRLHAGMTAYVVLPPATK